MAFPTESAPGAAEGLHLGGDEMSVGGVDSVDVLGAGLLRAELSVNSSGLGMIGPYKISGTGCNADPSSTLSRLAGVNGGVASGSKGRFVPATASSSEGESTEAFFREPRGRVLEIRGRTSGVSDGVRDLEQVLSSRLRRRKE